MILLCRPKQWYTTKCKWGGVGIFLKFNPIILMLEEFQKVNQAFPALQFSLCCTYTSISSHNWPDTLKTYRTTRQAAETLLHLSQYTYSCVLSNLPQHLGSKGKGRSLWPLPPGKGKHLLLWLCMYGNRSLTPIPKFLLTRTTFSS